MSADTTTTVDSREDLQREATVEKQGATPVAIQAATQTTTVVTPRPEAARGDVSASTIARMMGMATAAEFGVLDGKVDLLSTKINSVTGKLERISSALANVPSGSDLERIDVQISSLRTALNDALARMSKIIEDGVEKLLQQQKKNDTNSGAPQ